MQQPEPQVRFLIEETPRVPWLSVALAGAGMAPFPLLAAGLWLSPIQTAPAGLAWMADWGGAILAFLAGVRRGLAFRTPGGERRRQMATVIWLFGLAVLALVWLDPVRRLSFLLAGYVSLAILDPLAARREEAPVFFARLRPLQMLVPVASLAAAEVWLYRH